MTKFTRIFVVILLLTACTPAYVLNISPSTDQKTREYNGLRVVMSEMANSTVILIPPSEAFKKRADLGVIVFNRGRQAFDFGSENITATTSDGTSVHVYSYAELMDEERDRQKWAAVAVALSAVGNSMQAANAGYSTSYTTYSGNTYGTYGGTPYTANSYGTGYTTTYDPARAQAAQTAANRETAANINNMRSENAANEAALQSILKTTTVDPGQSFSGKTRFQIPSKESALGQPISFLVRAGDDNHRFEINIAPAR